jgi:hypothetical protein
MKLDEAVRLIEANKVPTYIYTIGGLGSGECIGIEFENGRWNVYYSERGSKNNTHSFVSEDEAVEYFLKEINDALRYLGRPAIDIPKT